MPPFIPDPTRIKSFATQADLETWLAAHHDRWPELWLKVHKKGSGLASVTTAEALDVALCYGWIDAIRKSFDAQSFLQRYTPRGPKSPWSQINRDNVARLVAAGRMTAHGQREVDKAKADGRWDAAYAPIRSASAETVPEDLRAAIAADPSAQRTFDTLDRQNLFALTFRVNAMRTPAGRARKVATLVAMLARGETLWPMKAAKTPATKTSAKTPAAKKTSAKKKTSTQPAERPARTTRAAPRARTRSTPR